MNNIKKIEIQSWDLLKIATLGNIEEVLYSAEILLEDNIAKNKIIFYDYPWVAGGLYTYAVEEFGKLLLLLSCKKSDSYVELDYSKFVNHNEKFAIALKELPEECKILSKAEDVVGNIPGYYDSIANKDTRFGIFYSDLDENGNLKEIPQVESYTMQIAIERFKQFISDFKTKHNID